MTLVDSVPTAGLAVAGSTCVGVRRPRAREVFDWPEPPPSAAELYDPAAWMRRTGRGHRA